MQRSDHPAARTLFKLRGDSLVELTGEGVLAQANAKAKLTLAFHVLSNFERLQEANVSSTVNLHFYVRFSQPRDL